MSYIFLNSVTLTKFVIGDVGTFRPLNIHESFNYKYIFCNKEIPVPVHLY